RIAARIAIMAMTTRSSISVKPRLFRGSVLSMRDDPFCTRVPCPRTGVDHSPRSSHHLAPRRVPIRRRPPSYCSRDLCQIPAWAKPRLVNSPVLSTDRLQRGPGDAVRGREELALEGGARVDFAALDGQQLQRLGGPPALGIDPAEGQPLPSGAQA